MVVISEKSLERIIEDVTPKVESLTGWDIRSDSLSVEIVRRDQHWEHACKPKYDSLGIDTNPKTIEGKKALMVSRYIQPYLLYAQYEPFTGTLLIVPDNIRFGTNESGIATMMGHELVHRCQFTNYPRFLERYSSMVRRMYGSSAFDRDKEEDAGVMKYLQAVMCLVEGDAAFVQGQLEKVHYKEAKQKTSYLSISVGLLLMVFGGEELIAQKCRQYEKGKKVVERVYGAKGRAGVNALYNLDEKALYQCFGR